MKVLISFLIAAMLLSVSAAIGQSFITKVSAKNIGKKDVLQIEYIAENADLDQFVMPELKNWNIISGPNFSSSTLQTGKIVKEETSYSIMVQPKVTGKQTIPGATALINNKPTRSNAVDIEVSANDHVAGNQTAPQNSVQGSLFDQFHLDDEPQVDNGQILKKGENAKDKIRNNIVIKLDVSKHTCKVGEPILATYKLCTRVRSQSRVVKQPMFNGCTVIEMTGNDDPLPRRETINGKSYNVYVIRRVQLFPLEKGKLILPSASVENKVDFYDASNFNYRDLYYNSPNLPVQEETVTLENAPVEVDVQELPPMPAVTNTTFSGAIGQYNVEVSTDTRKLESNNTQQLMFTIIGEGNIQQVKAPVINWPKGIEGFDATEQDQDDKTHFPVLIRKTFSFPFVADKAGTFVIPPIEFTYYDPNANRYVTRYSAPVTLHVAKGSKFKIPAFVKTSDAEGFQTRLYIILGAAITAVIIGLVWYNERHKAPLVKPVSAAVKPAEKEETVAEVQPALAPDTSKYIFAIRDLQPDYNTSTFYKELCKNLELYVEHKFDIPPAQLNHFIQQKMQEDFTFDQLHSLLENCNLGMYTPAFTVDEAMEHRLLAIEIVNRMERT